MTIPKRYKKEINEWLQAWADHIEHHMGRPGAVHAKRVDFKNMDFFYMTLCSDIIGQDPEFKKSDTENRVLGRKTRGFAWLLLKYLVDDSAHVNESWRICGHCGGNNCDLRGLPFRRGHYNYCPDCGRTQITTYPHEDKLTWEFIKQKIWNFKVGNDE